MTYEEMIRKRKLILASSTRHSIVPNHSANVHNARVCAVCGTPLSIYVPRLNDFQVIKKHYHYFYYDNQFSGSICYDPKSCYKNIERK